MTSTFYIILLFYFLKFQYDKLKNTFRRGLVEKLIRVDVCQQRPIVTTWRINGSNLLKHAQNKLNFPCALFSTMFILWWIQLIWNSSHFNIVGRHGLYVKHTNALSKSTLAANERRMHISNPRKASWDLFGSPKSPSLYTKFNIDGEVYNLEIDTGSFLTWFRCNYKLYQVTNIICS